MQDASMNDMAMAQRLAGRHAQILGEFGFFTAGQLAELNQSLVTDHDALADSWKKRRQVFAVSAQDSTGQAQEIFLGFQFEAGRPVKTVQQVLAQFDDRKTPWNIALWFTSNNGWLPGQVRPVDLLLSAPEAVIQAARFEAAGSSA